MKRNSCLIAGLTLAAINSFCQQVPVNEPDYNKPKIFQSLPVHVPVKMASLNSLFDQQSGQQVDINLSDSSLFRFEGQVTAVTNKYDGRIRSVVIRSVNYPGANFTVSKVTGTNGTTTYQGRIVSFAHGDLYQLQYLNGKYVLVKKNFYDLVNE